MTGIQKDKKLKSQWAPKGKIKRKLCDQARLPKKTLFSATVFHQPLQTLMHDITAKGQSPADLHIPLPIGVKRILIVHHFLSCCSCNPDLLVKLACGKHFSKTLHCFLLVSK